MGTSAFAGVVVATLAALLTTVATRATDPGPASTEAVALEPLVVTRPVQPLDEPYERLRRMMADPDCAGCPPLITVDRETVYLKAGKVFGIFTGYGLAPPDLSHEDRIDLHLAHDWRQAERVPEN